MTQFVATETDGDGDVQSICGPFPDFGSAMAWLEKRAKAFAADWSAELGGEKIKIDQWENGFWVHADCDPQAFEIVQLDEPAEVM